MAQTLKDRWNILGDWLLAFVGLDLMMAPFIYGFEMWDSMGSLGRIGFGIVSLILIGFGAQLIRTAQADYNQRIAQRA